MKARKFISSVMITALLSFMLTGCGSSDTPASAAKGISGEAAKRETCTTILTPEASGTDVVGSDTINVDISNISQGYCMVEYTGDADKIKIQITDPSDNTYTYTLFPGDFGTFPLSGGNGDYHIDVLEHAFDNMYALGFSHDFNAQIEDEFAPFLYPNQYVWFTGDSRAVSLAKELSDASDDDISFVTNVYEYVINNIEYDTDLAANVQPDYLPSIDRTLSSGKGICFDYASLMGSMLRSQNVPTRLQVGYSGTAYHAWISVYLTEIGWVDNIIEFDGISWKLMDPTLGAGNNAKAVAQYIGDGSNYLVKYSY